MGTIMHSDFLFVETEDRLDVLFCGECLAVFTPSNQSRFDTRTLQQRAAEYVAVYGYMAEWRRRWLNGDQCSWSEDLRVTT